MGNSSIVKQEVSLLRKHTDHMLITVFFKILQFWPVGKGIHLIQKKNGVQHRRSPQGTVDKWNKYAKFKAVWYLLHSALNNLFFININCNMFNIFTAVVEEIITLRGKSRFLLVFYFLFLGVGSFVCFCCLCLNFRKEKHANVTEIFLPGFPFNISVGDIFVLWFCCAFFFPLRNVVDFNKLKVKYLSKGHIIMLRCWFGYGISEIYISKPAAEP